MRAKRFRDVLACCLMVGSGLVCERASAHATPHVIDMLFPQDGYVLVSNRGLIFGDKQQTNWRLMCNEALGINTSERPSVVSLPGGKMLAGTSSGLSTSSDQGCTWQGVEPFASTAVPELMRDPHAPERLYLASYSDEADDKGGVYVSQDAGATWQKLLAADQRDYVRAIRVAPSAAERIYASGQSWDETGKYSHYVARSNDAGKTWQRFPIELAEGELEVGLYEIHPKNPEVLTARAGNRSPMSTPERLLVSRDGGKTWSSPLRVPLLSALAFSADGSKAWVVGQDGLYESRDELASFEKLGGATSLSYVVEREGQLFVAGFYSGLGTGQNGIGLMRVEPDMYDSFMQLSDVSAPVACDAASKTATICAPWWTDWQRELASGQFAPDAGVPADSGSAGAVATAGAAAGAGAAGSPPSAAGAGGSAPRDSGCVVASGRASSGLGWMIGLALLVQRRRRGASNV